LESRRKGWRFFRHPDSHQTAEPTVFKGFQHFDFDAFFEKNKKMTLLSLKWLVWADVTRNKKALI